MVRMKDMDPVDFGKLVKEKYPGACVVMLTYETLNDQRQKEITDSKAIDRIFYWSGNNRLLLTIIKIC